MPRTTPILAVIMFGLVSQRARADKELSASLEWWTSISNTIVMADVSDVKELKIPSLDWKSQQVTFKTQTVLKGDRPDTLVVQQEYLDLERFPHSKVLVFDRALHSGDRVLAFCARRDEKESKLVVIFWVNLTKPDARLALHAAFDNDGKLQEDKVALVALVKRRIEKEDHRLHTRKRGLIVDVSSTGTSSAFVRTSDPEYRKVLVEQLRKGSNREKEDAIYNLISFPGKETTDLIMPFLKDKTSYEGEIPNAKDAAGKPMVKKVKVYPLREMAFAALSLLGDSPEKPEGLSAEGFPGVFKFYFENRLEFPYGDWKRLEFPPPPPVVLGTVPPESIARVALADLSKSLERVCTEEKDNYHRLLWRAYHLGWNSTIGRSWVEVKKALEDQGATHLSTSKHEWGDWHSYRVKKNGYVTSKGLAHDLVLQFRVSDDSEESKVARVGHVHAKLFTEIKKPFAEFARSKPYPADTIVAKALAEANVAEAAKSGPILERIEIEYCIMASLSDDFSPVGFDVRLNLVDRNTDPTRGASITARATSGLDPPQRWDGKKALEEFRSRDSLEEFEILPFDE
jgi:hypothetical protein